MNRLRTVLRRLAAFTLPVALAAIPLVVVLPAHPTAARPRSDRPRAPVGPIADRHGARRAEPASIRSGPLHRAPRAGRRRPSGRRPEIGPRGGSHPHPRVSVRRPTASRPRSHPRRSPGSDAPGVEAVVRIDSLPCRLDSRGQTRPNCPPASIGSTRRRTPPQGSTALTIALTPTWP